MNEDKKLWSFHVILFWLTLTSGAPFIFYAWPMHPHKIFIFGALLIFIFFIIKKKGITINAYPIIVIIIMILYTIFRSIYDQADSLTLTIQNIAFLIMYIYLVNFVKIEKFAKTFIIIIILMGIGGVLTFLMSFLYGIKPIFEVPYGKNDGISYFFGLTTSNSFNDLGYQFIRYAGFFDEPGAYGLYAMYALILNRVFFNNKKFEILLLFLPLFCFSMAFYVVFLLYILFFLIKKEKIIYAVIFSIAAFFLFNYINQLDVDDKSNNRLYEATIGRFSLDGKGELENESRNKADQLGKKVFEKYPLLGDGETSGSSIFLLLSSQGIVGSIFHLSVWFIYFFLILKSKKNRILLLKTLFLILLSYYHRPQNTVLSMMVAFSLIHYLAINQKNSVSNKSLKTQQ